MTETTTSVNTLSDRAHHASPTLANCLLEQEHQKQIIAGPESLIGWFVMPDDLCRIICSVSRSSYPPNGLALVPAHWLGCLSHLASQNDILDLTLSCCVDSREMWHLRVILQPVHLQDPLAMETAPGRPQVSLRDLNLHTST